MAFGWLITTGGLLLLGYALGVTEMVPRLWAVGWALTVLATLVGCRFVIHRALQKLAHGRRFARRTLIYGAGDQGRRLAARLRGTEGFDTEVIGFIDDRKRRIPDRIDDVPLLGDTDNLLELIDAHEVDQIMIALPWAAERRILDLIRRIAESPVQIRLAPDLYGLALNEASFSEVAGLRMLRVFDRPISGWSFAMKSIEDKLLALIALVILAPLLLVIATLIKLDSSGPVLFRQRRHGFNNSPFVVWKFRTMRTDTPHQDGAVPATRNDHRVTRIGRFLRRSSLDELPQLFNVLKGDMSIVGPRPHPTALQAAGRRFEEVVQSYAARHNVKPGITGWAQVNGWRGEADTVEKIQSRVEHDLYYIDHWSLWLDLRIIVLTALRMWQDRNAY